MEGLLYFAAVLAVALGAADSFLGERYILTRLFRRSDLPKLFGSSELTTRTLRFAWHITTVAWFGFAALLVHAGRGDLTVSGMLQIIGLTFVASGILPLFFTRGKHLSWLVLFVIGGIALWCAAEQFIQADAASRRGLIQALGRTFNIAANGESEMRRLVAVIVAASSAVGVAAAQDAAAPGPSGPAQIVVNRDGGKMGSLCETELYVDGVL